MRAGLMWVVEGVGSIDACVSAWWGVERLWFHR